jgi:hypothetical protein
MLTGEQQKSKNKMKRKKIGGGIWREIFGPTTLYRFSPRQCLLIIRGNGRSLKHGLKIKQDHSLYAGFQGSYVLIDPGANPTMITFKATVLSEPES